MYKMILFIAVCSFGAQDVFAASRQQAGSVRQLKVMTYNVQNLFDTIDSPDTNDTEFTPDGKQAWSQAVLTDKMKNLAQVILPVEADVVAMQEIENESILEDFRKKHLGEKVYPYVAVRSSDDARGIRNAVVSRFPIVHVESHRVWSESWTLPGQAPQKTRDILQVDVRVPVSPRASGGKSGEPRFVVVTLLVNHWPSRGGGAAREPIRLDVARKMAAITAQVLESDPARLVISLGDFNDELNSPSIRDGVPLVRNYDELKLRPVGFLYPVNVELDHLAPEKKGTYFFGRDREWNTIDHIFVGPGRDLQQRLVGGFHYVAKSVRRVEPSKFMNGVYPQGCEVPFPDGVQKGRQKDRCPSGASDHLPLSAVFEYKDRQ